MIPRTVNYATYHLGSSQAERIHDRITNVARRVIFMVNGRMEDVNV